MRNRPRSECRAKSYEGRIRRAAGSHYRSGKRTGFGLQRALRKEADEMPMRSRGVVYVVDADVSVRQGLARLVQSAGLDAMPCESTEAFLRQRPAARRTCALIDVSDLMQCEPGQWARLSAAAQSLPIIALSPDDDPATRQLARALGAQAFFSKPVDAAALLDSIDWVMHAEGRG